MKYSIHFIALQTALQMKEQLAAGALEADTAKYFFPGELPQIDIVCLTSVQRTVMHLVVVLTKAGCAVLLPITVLGCSYTTILHFMVQTLLDLSAM